MFPIVFPFETIVQKSLIVQRRLVGAECALLPEIANGFVIDQTRKYFYGDEARVQCHRGFKLTGGPSIIKCAANQIFSNVPKCEGKLRHFLIS